MVNPEIYGELPQSGTDHFTIEYANPEQERLAPSPIDVRVHPLLEGDETQEGLLNREARLLHASRKPVVAYQDGASGDCIILIDTKKLVGPVTVHKQTVTWNEVPLISDTFGLDRLHELRHPHRDNAPFSHVLRLSLSPADGTNLSRVVITGNEESRIGPIPTRVVVEESRLSRPLHAIQASLHDSLGRDQYQA